MFDRLRDIVLAALRVPPDPAAPEGSPGSVLIFRAGRNFYLLQVLVWAVSHLGAAMGVIVGGLFVLRALRRAPALVQTLFVAGEMLALVAIAVAIPVTFLALKWQYLLRWYIVTDRSLRIRRGVWNVEELTMTFANIQEIRVTSGPVQNFLGLADVEVTSAGGGSSESGGEKTHVATFQGVDNAAEIRDLLVERLRSYRDLGLGGPVAVAESAGARQAHSSDAALAAARGVLEEARALRSAVLQSNAGLQDG